MGGVGHFKTPMRPLSAIDEKIDDRMDQGESFMIDLSLIWIVIIAVGVFIYVVLDGFDLGIGILFPFIKNQQERDVMMNTVAPVWDGNETWMV